MLHFTKKMNTENQFYVMFKLPPLKQTKKRGFPYGCITQDMKYRLSILL